MRRRRGRYTLRKTVRQVKRLKNAQERKIYTDNNTIASIGNSSWNVQNLNAIAVGDGRMQRNGDAIMMKYLHIQGILTVVPESTIPAHVRIVVFLVKNDLSNNTGLIDESELFDTIDEAGAVIVPTMLTPKNWANRYNIRTLYDVTHDLGAIANGTENFVWATGNVSKTFHVRVGVNSQAQWIRNGTGNQKTKGLLVMAACTSSAGSAIQLRYMSRLTYTDN